MEERHKTLLRHHRITFRMNLEPRQILPYLAEVLSEADEEEIMIQQTKEEQIDKLLNTLPRRGPQAFACFLNGLERAQPFLARILLQEQTEEDDNDNLSEMTAQLETVEREKLELENRNTELQNQLEQVMAERDQARDTCKQFEVQVQGYKEKDMEKRLCEMKVELGRARTHSAKLRDELRIANCTLESEKNKKDNLHKELDELKSLHKALLSQTRSEKDKLTFNVRELTATKEHLTKKLETEKQEKLKLEKSCAALEKELEKKTIEIEKLQVNIQSQTQWLNGHTSEVNNNQLVSRKLSYDELKTREKQTPSPRIRTYSEKQLNTKNHSGVNGDVSRQGSVNDKIDALYCECQEMLQCMKHSAENLELQKQLDQTVAERDLALDSCKMFEEQLKGYEEMMRNRVDVGTDAMENNEVQPCRKCVKSEETEEIKQQLERDIGRLTEETRKAECTMKEMIDKYEREKKCLESNLHKLQELNNTSRDDFANEIKRVRNEMTEHHLNEIKGLEHAKEELESQVEREKYINSRLKTELDKEKESNRTIHKDFDKYKKKATSEKKQMKKKLDEEIKSNSTCLKDLEAELKEAKEVSKKCTDDISRLQVVIRDQQEIQEMLREELARWKTLPGRVFNYKKDFDRNGIIYFFGTSFNTSQFTNPAGKESCRIRVTRSSNGEGHAMDILDPRKATLCCTRDEQNSWWQVDFGEEHALFVTHYTLRHGRDNGLSIIRNWNLEGSHDGKKWEILRKHDNDRGMKGSYPFYTGTWTVEERVQAMRYFRIHQTGKNSSGRYALYLSGFEMYGVLLDMC